MHCSTAPTAIRAWARSTASISTPGRPPGPAPCTILSTSGRTTNGAAGGRWSTWSRRAAAPRSTTRCKASSSRTRHRSNRLVEAVDARAQPDEEREPGQRDEEGEEEENLPAEAGDQVPRDRSDVDAPDRGERGEQRVLRRGEAPVAERHQ